MISARKDCGTNSQEEMNWQDLNSVEQVQTIKESSKQNAVLIFKHSTRCSISRTALDRLQRHAKPEEMIRLKAFYLDLLQHPDLSRLVAQEFAVKRAVAVKSV